MSLNYFEDEIRSCMFNSASTHWHIKHPIKIVESWISIQLLWNVYKIVADKVCGKILNLNTFFFSKLCGLLLWKKEESEIVQSRLILCNCINCSLPDSSSHAILQARILAWVLFPCPGDLPIPEVETVSPTLWLEKPQLWLDGPLLVK